MLNVIRTMTPMQIRGSSLISRYFPKFSKDQEFVQDLKTKEVKFIVQKLKKKPSLIQNLHTTLYKYID
jgi:hypothetical protein